MDQINQSIDLNLDIDYNRHLLYKYIRIYKTKILLFYYNHYIMETFII